MGRAPDSTIDQYRKRKPLAKRLRVPVGAQVVHDPVDTSAARGALTASAQVLSARTLDRKPKRAPVEAWQTEVWELRDETGELRFIGDRQARACGQVRMFIGRKDSADSEPVPVTATPDPDSGTMPDANDQMVAALADALFPSEGSTEQMVRRGAQHLIYNGETNLLISEDEATGKLTLTAHSVSELTGSAGQWKLNDGVDKPRDITDREIVIRCWTAHPEYGGRADAPVRAVLPVARELRALSQLVSAQADSRLAGAGLLLIPDGLESMHSQHGGDGDDDDDLTLADELTDYMTVPIKDRDSAAAVVPIMLTGNGEMLDQVRHLTFATPLDAEAASLRDEAIRRIGLGMDSDPSVLLGQASSNHWSAWAVDENETKFGVAPVCATLCHALTVGLLWPLLADQGVPDPQRYVVWFDTTPLTVRPDRSKDAQALYERGAISAAVLRRENGFDDADAPSDDEMKKTIVRDLISARSDLIDKLLPELGIIIPGITDNAERVDDTLADDDTGQVVDTAPTGPAPEPDNSPPVMGETEATQ